MHAEAWKIVLFTMQIAALSTVLILPLGIATAWLLTRPGWRGKALVETCAMLPLFLPPVATGLILLALFGRRGPLGAWLERAFGIEFVFTWRAVVLACAVMSFPLLVRAAQSAFQEVNPRLEHLARTLGAGEWRPAHGATVARPVWGGSASVFVGGSVSNCCSARNNAQARAGMPLGGISNEQQHRYR